MEEDRLKDLFKEYKPELSSQVSFIERLERNLNAVEIVHKENARAIRRNKIAVLVASVVGFVTGFIFSYLTPFIEVALSRLSGYCPDINWLYTLNEYADYRQVASWMIIGAISVFASIGTYNGVVNYLPLRYERPED